MEKWNSILFVKIKLFILKVPILGQEHPADLRGGKKTLVKVGFNRWSPSCFRFRVWFPFYIIARTEVHVVQRVPLKRIG